MRKHDTRGEGCTTVWMGGGLVPEKGRSDVDWVPRAAPQSQPDLHFDREGVLPSAPIVNCLPTLRTLLATFPDPREPLPARLSMSPEHVSARRLESDGRKFGAHPRSHEATPNNSRGAAMLQLTPSPARLDPK